MTSTSWEQHPSQACCKIKDDAAVCSQTKSLCINKSGNIKELQLPFWSMNSFRFTILVTLHLSNSRVCCLLLPTQSLCHRLTHCRKDVSFSSSAFLKHCCTVTKIFLVFCAVKGQTSPGPRLYHSSEVG